MSLSVLLLVTVAVGCTAELPKWYSETHDFLRAAPEAWRTRLVSEDDARATPTGMQFSTGFSDHAVLQRGDKVRAAVYGTVGSAPQGAAVVTVTVFENGQSKAYKTDVEQDGTWKVLLDPHPAGGNLTITAACTSGCTATDPATIRDVTYGDVWFCSGQSNMELISMHTFERNDSIAAIKAGKYQNVRIYLHPHIASSTPQWVHPATPQNSPLPMQWNTAKMAADLEMPAKDYMHPTANLSILTQFSGLCWYFAQELTDLMGDNAVPLGMMDVSWGGTMIEQWSTNETTSQCRNTSMSASSGQLYNGMVGPFANMSLSGWLWYQGENNIGHGTSNPNYLEKLGYACQLPAMIDLWRRTWSATSGTTDPMAPFGVVDIAEGGGEGHGSNGAMGNFRWAQTASFGVLPNKAMPNTFIANAYDLGDPWAKDCFYKNCCTIWSRTPSPGPGCVAKYQHVWNWDDTTFYMGPIHARPKQPLGQRLARGAFNTHYGGKGAVSGPVINKCEVETDGSGRVQSFTVTFDQNLLKGDTVKVNAYSKEYQASNMQVLVNATLPTDGWHVEMKDQWQYVDMTSASPYSVKIDATSIPAGSTIGGLRYAWEDRSGCGSMDKSIQPCPPASYPIMSSKANLPAMPFQLRVENGQCKCIAPQVC